MTDTAYSHWSRYWASGPVTSLPQDFQGNYDGELADFWQGIFDGLPEDGRVLDVCTGNGAIALMAARHPRVGHVQALDAAEIRPDVMRARHPEMAELVDRVEFLGGQPLEQCRLPDASVDLVTSQYGLEYTDWRAVAERIARLLRPGGRLAFVSHAPDSDMMAVMSREAREYELLFEPAFLPALSDCLSRRGDESQVRRHLSALTERIRGSELYEGGRSALLHSVLEVGSSLLRLPAGRLRPELGRLRQYVAELTGGQRRLRDMLEVNQALLRHPDWFQAFEQAGLVREHRETLLYRGRHRCGEAFVFHRP